MPVLWASPNEPKPIYGHRFLPLCLFVSFLFHCKRASSEELLRLLLLVLVRAGRRQEVAPNHSGGGVALDLIVVYLAPRRDLAARPSCRSPAAAPGCRGARARPPPALTYNWLCVGYGPRARTQSGAVPVGAGQLAHRIENYTKVTRKMTRQICSRVSSTRFSRTDWLARARA